MTDDAGSSQPGVAGKRTVYAVSSGEYSGYGVHDLFEDQADAEATAQRVGGYVEEFDLYPPGNSETVASRPRYLAMLFVAADGTISGRVDEGPIVHFEYVNPDSEPQPPSVHKDFYGNHTVQAWTDDRESAVKAVREQAAKVAALMAEGGDPMTVEWGNSRAQPR